MPLLEFLFGRPKTPEELLMQYKPILNKYLCDLDLERVKLEQLEKEILCVLKTAIREQMDVVKLIAEDCVRIRRYLKFIITLQENIQRASLQMETLCSSKAIVRQMNAIKFGMASASKSFNHPCLQEIFQTFEDVTNFQDTLEDKRNGDTDLLETDGVIMVESDAIVVEVCNELGGNVSDRLKDLTNTDGIHSGELTETQALTDAELESRLQNLKEGMHTYLLYSIGDESKKQPSTEISAETTVEKPLTEGLESRLASELKKRYDTRPLYTIKSQTVDDTST